MYLEGRGEPEARVRLLGAEMGEVVTDTSTWRHTMEVGADAVSVSKARRFTADRLADLELGPMTDDVVLVVSELVTRALAHAHSAPILTLRGDERTLLVSVHDGSSTAPPASVPQPRDGSGRGLSIVSTLSDDWGTDLDESAPAKSIWASFTR